MLNLKRAYFLVIHLLTKLINHKTLVIKESMHVVFEESNPFVFPRKDSVDVVFHVLNLIKHEENNIVKEDQKKNI